MQVKEKQNKSKKLVIKSKKILIFKIFILISIFLPVYFQESIFIVKAQTYTNISVQQAHDMIINNTLYPDLIVLDVRSQSEFDTNHLCNATLIPSTELESRINELVSYNETEIIVYCLSGGRSATASQILVDYGFIKVFNMFEGISGWISVGYEVCPSGQTQPIISFSLISFLLFFLASFVILIAFSINKKNKK